MAREAWRPTVGQEPDFNPFTGPTSASDSPLKAPTLLEPDEDTAPLQGSKDLSDDDSLDDVVAEADDEAQEQELRSRGPLDL